jgi:hypothetical protein
MLNKTSVDDRAWCWVRVRVVILLNETSVDLLIDEAVEDLRVVVGLN